MGAIFRTADGAGVNKIWLTGYTPAPVDEFKRASKEIEKTALGAEKMVAWEKRENILDLLKELKSFDYQIWALEQSEKSVNYKLAKLAGPTALIVGNEVEGIEPEVLNQCDQIIEIPMRGEKESLNVSAATAVAVFSLID